MGRRTKRKKKKPTATSQQPSRGKLYVAFLALCALGALLSLDLLRIHVKVHTDGYDSYCTVSQSLDCAAVAASNSSLFAGLPLAVWGLLGYALLAAWAVWGTRAAGRGPTWPWGTLFGLSLAFSAIGLWLYYVSHFVIHSVCLVCAATYLANFALLVVAALELRRRGASAFSALGSELGLAASRPAAPLLFAAILAIVVLALRSGIPPYWTIDRDGPGGLTTGLTSEGLPWIGATDPQIEIVEFSDYQCPHCLRGHDAMRQLVQDYPDRVRLVHRHYPLDQACNPKITRPFHLFACRYARLAWCAGEAGRFWEANDYLFQMGKREDGVSAAELARQLGLDAGALEACESGRAAAAEVDHDLAQGRRVGVSGTPTFIMNGEVYSGGIPPEAIEAALRGARAR